jgi:methyltransferase (TIGR00027 family)
MAAQRARHFLYDKSLVFEDPFAYDLTSPIGQWICRSSLLQWLFFKKLMHGLLFSWAGEVLGRSRYAEDKLEEAIAAGVTQYVSVGAGCDSFALRRTDLGDSLRVFELDHTATQRVKQERLSRITVKLPKNLEFVPIDLELESISDALACSSYRRDLPAFFALLGVMEYLRTETAFETLRSIASVAAPGSELVFDHLIPDELLEAKTRRRLKAVRRGVALVGEPWRTAFDPRRLSDEVASLGYELVEHLSPAEQQKRYFAGRTDGIRSNPAAYYARLRVRAVPSR